MHDLREDILDEFEQATKRGRKREWFEGVRVFNMFHRPIDANEVRWHRLRKKLEASKLKAQRTPLPPITESYESALWRAQRAEAERARFAELMRHNHR